MNRINLVIFFLPFTAFGAWNGFPFQTNTSYDTYDSYELLSVYRPLSQIYSAQVERCLVAGVATPTNIQVWSGLWAGTNAEYVTQTVVTVTNSISYTNIYILTNWVTQATNFTTTNCFDCFTYPYTDASGAHTATGFVTVTHDLLTAIDAKTKALLDSNKFIVPDYSNHFWKTHVIGSTTNYIELSDMPLTYANAFLLAGVGYVTNYYTNSWGFTNALTVNYTYQPATTNIYVLGQINHRTNDVWSYSNFKSNDACVYDLALPVVRYYATSTNPFVSFDLTLSGDVLNVVSNQTLISTTETVSVSSAGGANLTLYWWSITNISCTTAPANTGDVAEVRYENTRAVYAGWPWDLSNIARDVDERYKVLNTLQYTYQNQNGQGEGIKRFNKDFSFDVVTNDAAFWTSMRNDAIAFYNASSNWMVVAGNDYFEYSHFCYGWDDGEGNYSIGVNMDHLYNAVGSFVITNIYTAVAHGTKLYAQGGGVTWSGWPFYDYASLGVGKCYYPMTPYTQLVEVASQVVSSNIWTTPSVNPATIIPASSPGTYDSGHQVLSRLAWALKWDFEYK